MKIFLKAAFLQVWRFLCPPCILRKWFSSNSPSTPALNFFVWKRYTFRLSSIENAACMKTESFESGFKSGDLKNALFLMWTGENEDSALKAHLHPRVVAVVCFCFEMLYCPNAWSYWLYELKRFMRVSYTTRAGGKEYSWSLIAFSLDSRSNKWGGFHIWKMFLGAQYILGECGPLKDISVDGAEYLTIILRNRAEYISPDT